MADLFHFVPPDALQGLAGCGGVDGVAIGPGHNARVVGAFGPPLDLQGVQTSPEQFRNVVDHAHITGIENIRAALVLPDGEIFAGALLLHQGVMVAAGLGARAAVGVSARHIIGEQAPPRVAHAHGPVDESLQLQCVWGFGADKRDLVQGELTGQDHPACAKLMPSPGGLVVGHAGLGGDVGLHGRGIALQQGEHPHVGQDDGVHPQVLEVFHPFRQTADLVVAGHGVARHMDGHAPPVAERHRLAQLVRGEVSGKGAHAEVQSGQIDRVGPVGQGHAQPLHIPRGGEEFHALIHCGTAPGSQ